MATIHKWERYGIYSYFGNVSSSDKVSLKSTSTATYDRYVSNYIESGTVSTKASNLTTSHYISYNGADYKITDTSWGVTASKITSYNVKKGTYIDVVESENTSAYPENGAQDGYWYVYAGSYDNFEPSVFATIGGVQKKLTSIPAMVDGVQRELTSLFATVDGVVREIFSVGSGGSTISFTIDGVTYEAESGMTWRAWVNSGYNTGEFLDVYSTVCEPTNWKPVQDPATGTNVALSSVITSGCAYYFA